MTAATEEFAPRPRSQAQASGCAADAERSLTYDPRRLGLKGLVIRVQHTNTYALSDDGICFADTYTKLGRRVLPPLLAVDHPPAPTELRQSFWVLDNHVDDYLEQVRVRLAACKLTSNVETAGTEVLAGVSGLAPDRLTFFQVSGCI
ncbi:MAG: hypothetical protein ACYCTL_10860 [Acidimicrobiales bacterium]